MLKKIKKFKPNSIHQLTFIKEILDPENSIIALVGGRQAGKSWAGAAAVGALIYNTNRCKKGLGWVICPDFPQSKAASDAIEQVLGWAAEGGVIIEHKVAENAYIFGIPGGSTFRLEIKTAVNPDGLRGRAVDFLWFDEAALLEEYCWTTALPTLLSTGGPVFCTTTPKGKNWFYNQVYQKSQLDPTIKVIRGLTDDNPDLQPKMREVIKSQHSGKVFQQEIMAEFVTMQGLIYPYDSDLHEFPHDPEMKQIPPQGEMIAGIDFGYKDPFVHLWVWKGYDGSYWVLDEHYERMKTTDWHADKIKGHSLSRRVTRRWADPSAAQGRADLERLRIGTFQAQNDQKLGINLVARLLENRKLHISKKCVNLMREFQNYEWAKQGDKPKTGQEDHALDTLRYIIASEDFMGCGGSNPVSYTQDDGSVIVEEGDGGGLYNHIPTIDQPDAEGTYGWSIDGVEQQ